MSWARSYLLMIALSLVWPMHVSAGQRVPGSFFPNPHPELRSQWLSPRMAGKADIDSQIVATAENIELRLAIPPAFVGPNIRLRIYIGLPAQLPGMRNASSVEYAWQAQRQFLSGSVRSGQRALLFEGTASSNVLSDILSVRITADGRELLGVIHMEPFYEIERIN